MQTDADGKREDAVPILKKALQRIGRDDLLGFFVQDGWDRIVALRDITKSDAVGLGLKPGVAVQLLAEIRHLIKISLGDVPKKKVVWR